MSRIGKTPIKLPKEVKVAISNNTISLEGPKGKLSLDVPFRIKVEQKEDQLLIQRAHNSKQDCSNHGTVRALINNMVEGITKGHKKELEIKGVGFRVQLQGTKLVMSLGFSHPVEYDVPKEVKVTVPSLTQITIEGIDKAAVGHVAAKIRDFKRPEPYKGKGIRYVGEVVKRKQGKSVTK